MRWEEIEAGWEAMTRRVRADRPASKPGNAPTQTVSDRGREQVTTDTGSETGVLEGSMP
jgi:hypothetical protein